MKREVAVEPWSRKSLFRLILACTVLTLALGAAFPLFAWHASARSPESLTAAALAGAVCWLGAMMALLVTAALQGAQAITGVMLGMLLRMGLPLGAAMILSSDPTLSKAGVFGYIVAYYLLTLAVETPLTLLLIRTRPPAPDLNPSLSAVSKTA